MTRVLELDQAVVRCQNPLAIWDLHAAVKDDETLGSGFKKKNLGYVTDKPKSCLESGKLQEGEGQLFREFVLNPSQRRLCAQEGYDFRLIFFC